MDDVTTIARRDWDLWSDMQRFRVMPGSLDLSGMSLLNGAIDVLRAQVDGQDARRILDMKVYALGDNYLCIKPGRGPGWKDTLYMDPMYCFDLSSDEAVMIMHHWFHNRLAWAFSMLEKGHPLRKSVIGRFAEVLSP